jgi:GT2 family glycosyltransferase
VDDCSTDDSAAVAEAWMRAHAGRFTRARLMRPQANGGSGAARNLGAFHIDAPYVFMLDADNLLYPRCLRRHLEAISEGGASVAYGIIERFGEDPKLVGWALMGQEPWRADRFVHGNFIDTMAMLRREHLLAVGGYSKSMFSWEDYDLYCTLVDHGYHGIQVPEILSRYRVHGSSKFHTKGSAKDTRPLLLAEMKRRHPWLKLV